MSADPAIKTAAEALLQVEYFKVPSYIFKQGEKLANDVYIYQERHYLIFKSKGSSWGLVDAEKLVNANVESLYIKFPSHREHHDFLQNKLKNFLESKDVTPEAKAVMLHDTADPIINSCFKTPGSAELIAGAGKFAKSCIQYLNERGSMLELVKLSTACLDEHTHGLQTSAYSVALAKRAGYKDQNLLLALGLGALLHDIGKAKLPPQILHKPSDLDENEWQLMRQHPELGEQILDNKSIVPLLAKQIVKEHHERVNGKGYPRGLKNLHPFSRIVGIAECFNSLTSNRVYAKAMPPFEALKFMIQTMRHEFDQALLEKFIELLS